MAPESFTTQPDPGLTLINILPLATLSSTSDKDEKNTLSQKPIYPSVGFMCDIS